MKGLVTLALLLGTVRLARHCQKVDSVLLCQDALTNFTTGCTTMFVSLRDVGVINSTVLQSIDLVTITRFESRNSGITRISEKAFSSLPDLEVLILDNNKLSNFNQNWFKNPGSVRELLLSFNRIADLNESNLTGLTNLLKLKLNGNRIRNIHPDSFSSQSRLTDLDLSENRLTRLFPQIFVSLRSVMSIRLHGNPWSCSCDAQDFVDSLKGFNSSQLVNRMRVTCETPPHLKGQPVLTVSVCSPTPPPGSLSSNQTTTTTDTVTTQQQPPGQTVISFQASSTDPLARTAAPTDPSTTSSTKICTLIAVIVALCVMLLGVCFMAALHRRNRSNKAVRPGYPAEEKENQEEANVSRQDLSAGSSERGNQEMTQRRSVATTRAKSANAILLSSPFCVTEKDKVTSQTESEVHFENLGKVNLRSKSGVEIEEGFNPETLKTLKSTEERAGKTCDNQESTHVSSEVTPYLSVGAMRNELSPDKETAEDPGTPERDKLLRRISTWPPTAAQWWAKCTTKQEQEEVDDFAVWTQNVTVNLSEDVKTRMELPSSSDQLKEEEEIKMNQTLSGSSKPPDTPVSVLGVEGMMLDPDSASQAEIQVRTSPALKPVEHPAQKKNSKANLKKDHRQSVTNRQRPENRAAAGSKVPSGGASPDDETLLSGNQYAYMDLLHEVVQNNGRWTRERWKQTHGNTQRR